MYVYQGSGGQYGYVFTDPTYSTPPALLMFANSLSESALEAIAEAICGGTPPSGYTISTDTPPVVVKTY